jgi:CheY-like chemotaxis protein
MIYGFVRQSGGHITISSEVGVGTTVRICLPRGAGEAEELAPVPPPSPPMVGHGTILVVDDSSEMRQVAERHLRFLGYRVLSAESGPAALAVIRTNIAIDLLFTDIAMPEGMSGFELAGIAEQMRPGLKVLFTTGFAGTDPELFATGWQERMIRKPYRRSELAAKVRAVLDLSAAA